MDTTEGQSTAALTALLTVSRRVAGDIGHREIFVSLDGAEFAILQNGDAVTRAVSAGPHRLRVHNTMFWKTIEFDAPDGGHVEFTTRSRAGWGTYGVATFLGAGPVYLDVKRS